MILVLAGSALTYFFAAVSFVGSVAEPVPFAPALRSRIASSFTSSITPAGTGGMALGMRTLQRTGLDPASATASIGINQVAGVLVHIALLFAFVTWTGRSGLGGFSLPDSTAAARRDRGRARPHRRGARVPQGAQAGARSRPTGRACGGRRSRGCAPQPGASARVARRRGRHDARVHPCPDRRDPGLRRRAQRPADRRRVSSVRRSSATRHRPPVDSVPSKPRSLPRSPGSVSRAGTRCRRC